MADITTDRLMKMKTDWQAGRFNVDDLNDLMDHAVMLEAALQMKDRYCYQLRHQLQTIQAIEKGMGCDER